jgi:hypothetical protein
VGLRLITGHLAHLVQGEDVVVDVHSPGIFFDSVGKASLFTALVNLAWVLNGPDKMALTIVVTALGAVK